MEEAEGLLAKVLTRFLSARGKEVARAIVDALGLKKSVEPMDDHGSRIEHAFETVDWNWTSLRTKVEPILIGVATGAGEEALHDLGVFSPEVLAKMRSNARDFAIERAAEMVGMEKRGELLLPNSDPEWTIADATREMIRGVVNEALTEGWSAQETANAIRDSEGFSATRAETIARTETAIADVQGTLTGWKASDLVAAKQWLTAPDCCDECQDLDGEEVPIDQEFDDGDPPLHPNCRCTVIAILNDELPEHGTEED